MHAIWIAAQGIAAGKPFRDPAFATSDRSRWYGEAFPLTVDWIYPYLSASDKRTIRTVFLRWIDQDTHAGTTTDNHPEPIDARNNPILVRDRTRVRYAGNNYYTAHMRNIGLMAMALDPADDPGGKLRQALDDATGAWLYVEDYLMRHDARGGLMPEGFEYSPQTIGYVAQLLLALHTAGQDDPSRRGAQVVLARNQFWTDLPTAYLHSISPATVSHPWLGPVYQPAWYGDGQHYWVPDFIEAFGPLGLYDEMTARSRQLNALRWIEMYTAPGGKGALLDRIRRADTFVNGIFTFLLFEPHLGYPSDPRRGLATTYFAPGVRHILARTDWSPRATWFDYSLDWLSVDHQHGDANAFELYRRGTWLTKERTGYGYDIASSDYHNTLALQNSPPAHNESGDYRHTLWLRGSQWLYGTASGDGTLLAYSANPRYVYASGDAAAVYNSRSEGSTDITQGSRSILWFKPDIVVVYDRASSRTAGRFKRFWLQLPNRPSITGTRATMTAGQQQLIVTSLLPLSANISAQPDESLGSQPADREPMHYRLEVEARGGPTDVRFLHVLQGVDAGAKGAVAVRFRSRDGAFDGVQLGTTAVLFPNRLDARFTRLVYDVNRSAQTHVITGLRPGGRYTFSLVCRGSQIEVTVSPGVAYRADRGGVLLVTNTRHTSRPVLSIDRMVHSATTRRRVYGHVVYRLSNGHVYRIEARPGARREDVSAALSRLSPRGSDDWLNISPDGDWLLLSAGRFGRACIPWTCLDLVKGDLSKGETIHAKGQPVRADGFGADHSPLQQRQLPVCPARRPDRLALVGPSRRHRGC
jgi:hypothetical protein